VISKATKPRGPVGTTFSFVLNEPASVALAFNQIVHGRKVHGRCVAQTKKNRKSRACSSAVTKGTVHVDAHTGTNRIVVQGRLSRSQLEPGRYTLAVVATNAAGQRSRPRSLMFTILK
jgi:predicted phage tail protein